MSKVQCTFRLPVEVVELIDKQDGNTRTDKLLSLLGFEREKVDYAVMQGVINNEITQRFEEFENRVLSLEEASARFKNVSSQGKKTPRRSSYEERTKDVIERCKLAWDSLDEEEQKGITKKGFAELSGVARGTVTKYWDVFTRTDS